MPDKQTKFCAAWLSKEDINCKKVGEWCKEGKSQYDAHCILCVKDFRIATKGFADINQHAKSKKHLSRITKDGQRLFEITSNRTVSISGSDLWKTSHPSFVSQAEGLWCMQVAHADYSFNSCQNISEILKTMFPDSIIGKDFKCGRNKVSYVITHGIGPHLKKELIYDINRSKSYYTLVLDETTTSQVKKQMDMYLRYWSPSTKKVECRYYTSSFFGHARASDICSEVTTQLLADGISAKHMLMLSTDGPNVQIAVHNQLNDFVKANGSPGLINIGTCNLHIVHNAFHDGLETLNWDIEDFAVDIHQWFKLSSARREDYCLLQALADIERHLFLRHVPSRWLSLLPVVKRLLEQLPTLKKYFQEWLPKNDPKSTKNNARFSRISSWLKDPTLDAKLSFVAFLAEDFSRFQTLFQSEHPVIHILYPELCDLMLKMILKFLKPSEILDASGHNLITLNVKDGAKQLELKSVNIGLTTKCLLKNVSEFERKNFLHSAQKCYIAIVEKLQKKLPLSNPTLKFLQCLHPLFRREKIGEKYILALANKLKNVFESEEDLNKITQEWRLYFLEENINEDWFREITTEGDVEWKRVDEYWERVFSIEHTQDNKSVSKYPSLRTLIRASCVLSHGNADVERGFSFNKNVVSTDRTALSEETIMATRHVKDAVKHHGGKPQNVPMTKGLISAIQSARKNYQVYLEIEKSKSSTPEGESQLSKPDTEVVQKAEGEMKSVKEKVSVVNQQENVLEEDFTVTTNMMKEGTKKLERALKSKDFLGARAAQAILEAGHTKMTETLANQIELNKRKRKIIEKQNTLLVKKISK